MTAPCTAATHIEHKVPIALGALAMPFKLKLLDLSKGEQKQPDFLAFYPYGSTRVQQWLTFQIGGIGSMLGHNKNVQSKETS